jgi:hypothetical protein
MIQPMSDSGADQTPPPAAPPPRAALDAETCDYCGSANLQWIKCKLVCRNCHQINKSCSDL